MFPHLLCKERSVYVITLIPHIVDDTGVTYAFASCTKTLSNYWPPVYNVFGGKDMELIFYISDYYIREPNRMTDKLYQTSAASDAFNTLCAKWKSKEILKGDHIKYVHSYFDTHETVRNIARIFNLDVETYLEKTQEMIEKDAKEHEALTAFVKDLKQLSEEYNGGIV